MVMKYHFPSPSFDSLILPVFSRLGRSAKMVQQTSDQIFRATVLSVLHSNPRMTERRIVELVTAEYSNRGLVAPAPSDTRLLATTYGANIGYIFTTQPRVFMDVTIGGIPAGRMTFELYADICPLASANFIGLCTGEFGQAANGTVLSYQGTPVHGVVPGFCVHSGDIEYGNGTGGMSVFGQDFRDESFIELHGERGLLSMVSNGPDSNRSQFMVMLGSAPLLNDRQVVFGRMIVGNQVLAMVEAVGSVTGLTTQTVMISECDQI